MDDDTKLRLAVVATRRGGASLVARVRSRGDVAFTDLLSEVPEPELGQLYDEATELRERGVGAVLLGSPEYPSLLSSLRSAPPCLFYRGPIGLLAARGIGLCGSRNATDEGLRAAAACAEVAVQQGLTVVSGYARGVDTVTHVSALASGGTTVVVLPEGINHFRVKRGPIADSWDPNRALVISQFSPNRPWSAGNAMARNNVIIGLSLALVVVEAGDKGGTLAAGTKALQVNRRVFALEFSQTPRGNVDLVRNGAVSISGRAHLLKMLDRLDSIPSSNQNQLSII
jgi:DNA processing protein